MNMNECRTYDDSYYNYYYEPVYNYYTDYNDIDPSLDADSTYNTVSTDDLVFDESQTGVTNYAQQDFSGGFDVTKAKTELNLQTQRQLPYIQIRDPPLKLLIDTGANQSFLSPEAVEKYFPEYPLNFDPFEITNIHATSRNSITLPSFAEFNDANSIKLFVYRFHDYFDGLIGLDLLNNWEARIDLKENMLVTRSAINPIVMYNSCNVNLYEDIIPAGSTKFIRIPIDVPEGDVFIREQILCNCIIHECLTTVSNNRGYLEVENLTQNDVIISLDRPAHAELYNIKCSSTEQISTRAQEVVSRLRTNHLNPEEKANLIALCSRYSDVFYIEGEELTFTNKIKHRIRTTDDVPVYAKSYRYPFVHRQEVRDQITKMLDQGIIRPSESA